MTKKEVAVKLSSAGFNCSQAVLGAFCEDLGLDQSTALKMATSFGGGMRSGEVCGAVTGALMALGLKVGHAVEGDLHTKAEAYALTTEFMNRFKEQHGTVLCKELLGYDVSDEVQYEQVKASGLFDTVCPKAIGDAVALLENMIKPVYVLENETIKIRVSEKGAELQSVYDKVRGHEWLWQGDSKWWGKRAPVLFPFIGCLKDGQYELGGKKYHMSKHGFARDKNFECVAQTNHQLVFSLKSDDETRAMYPYEFEFRIIYTLEAAKVTVSHEVYNLNDETMMFSLGGHPAFNCPMDEATWELEFEKPEKLESYGVDLTSGLILTDLQPVPMRGTSLPLTSALFKNDALVFENLNSNSVILKRTDGSRSMKFEFEEFPLLALWSPMGPFICLEPWFGMADHMDHEGCLEKKYGVEKLGAGRKFECAYSVSFI